MFTAERLYEVTKDLPTIDQKGKPYVQVKDRIKAFRTLEPNGSIVTEILSLQDGMVVMKATVSDEDGKVLGTGIAYEVEGVGFVNKTSFIENCETGAVGRALAMLGIGITDSIASAEEIQIAQGKSKLASTVQRKTFQDMCEKLNQSPVEILSKSSDWAQGERMTEEQYAKAIKMLMDIENEGA